MIERGTLRRGFSVSSASGTAASQPVSPCTVRTTTMKKPEVVAMPPGLNEVVKVCKGEAARAGIGETGQAERQHDQELRQADDDDPLDRERNAGVAGPGHQRNADDDGTHHGKVMP